MTTLNSTQEAQAEREAFEDWYSQKGQFPNAIVRLGDGYRLAQAHQNWSVWQARAALTSREPVQAPAGWQPIETAPKDGTELLLVDDEGIRTVGRWSKHGWIRQVELYGIRFEGFDAVAWAHLPPSPAKEPT